MKRSRTFVCFQLHVWLLTVASLSLAVNADFRINDIVEKFIIIKSDAYNSIIYLKNNSILQLLGDAWYIRAATSTPLLWEQFNFQKEDGAYSVRNLSPNTSYLIRNVRLQNEYDAPDLQIQTCPEKPPRVELLRLNEAGLGWLDIRWKQPKEQCSSVITYKVSYRYMTNNGEWVSKTILFDVPKEKFFHVTHAQVSQPCDTWPNEFCVLLTENIYPGINYEVQVQTGRYIFSSNTDQVSEPMSIYVTSNASNFGPVNAVQCQTRQKTPRRLLKEKVDCTEYVTPSWIIILTSVFIAMNTGIIITFLIRRCIKKRKKASERCHTSNVTNKSELPNSDEIYDYPERQNVSF